MAAAIFWHRKTDFFLTFGKLHFFYVLVNAALDTAADFSFLDLHVLLADLHVYIISNYIFPAYTSFFCNIKPISS